MAHSTLPINVALPAAATIPKGMNRASLASASTLGLTSSRIGRRGRPFHFVSIEGDPASGRLIGSVEFFSVCRMVVGLSDCYAGRPVKASYAIDPTTGAELNLDVDFTFTDDDLRFALSNEDDATPAQVQAMNEVMTIAQELSFKREEACVARRAYQTTLSKLDLKPGQDMTLRSLLR